MGYGSQSSKSSGYGGPTSYQKAYGKEYLDPFFKQQGTSENPYYSDLSRMYDEMMKNFKPGVAPEVSNTINEMVTTGSPFDQSAIYKAAMPTYQRTLDEATADVAEKYGVRGSGSDTYFGKAVGGATEDFNKYLTEMTMQSQEAAAGRRMQAIPYAFQEGGYPLEQFGKAVGATQQQIKAQYPWISEAMQYFAGGPNVTFQDTSSSGEDYGCKCRIFTEDWTKELEGWVRHFRDEHYLPSSHISKGYKMMSKWLVPLMMKSKLIRIFVRLVMLKPMSRFASLYYHNDIKKFLYVSICYFWATIWSLSSRTKVAIS